MNAIHLGLSIQGKIVRPKVNNRIILAKLEELIEDEFEDEFEHDPEPEFTRLYNLALILEYENAKREVSQRLVTCYKFESKLGHHYLRAICHLRDNFRTFRLDRIRNVIDPETGELLGEAFGFFEPYLGRHLAQRPKLWGLDDFQAADLIALLTVAVFIACCDREYHHLEHQALEAVVTKFWLRREIVGEPDLAAIEHYTDHAAPSDKCFMAALAHLSHDPKLIQLVRECVADIIAADGHIAPEEFHWGALIDEYFKENAI